MSAIMFNNQSIYAYLYKASGQIMIKKIFASILYTFIAVLINACGFITDLSEYKGGFAAQDGECTKIGDVAISVRDNKIDIGFYCFLKLCGHAVGTVAQGGYFNIELEGGYYIQGKLASDNAQGNWFLPMSGKSCLGNWTANRINQ